MKTPPTIHDTDDAPGGGDDRDDWAQWEQTFRDARPVLPEVAMLRIHQAIGREIARPVPSTRRPSHDWHIAFIVVVIVAAVAGTAVIWRASKPAQSLVQNLSAVQEYPLLAPPAPKVIGPETSALPLTKENRVVVNGVSQTLREGIATFQGPVEIRIGSAIIRCDRLTVFKGSEPDARLLSGSGNVSSNSLAGYQTIAADEFTFNTGAGQFTFSGHVRLTRESGTSSVGACTITRQGALVIDSAAR